MSAWKAGKIQWYNTDGEEGIVIDKESGAVFYLNKATSDDIKKIKGRKKGKKIRYKTKEDFRGISVSIIKEV